MTNNILSKDIILKHTNCNDIYIKFLALNDFPKSNISSPFTDDKKPSFKLYPNGTFKCNSSGKQGDVWQFVADIKQLDSKTQFKEVLQIVATEMQLNCNDNLNATTIQQKTTVNPTTTATTTNKTKLQQNENDNLTTIATMVEPKKLTVAIRDYTSLDLEYWKNLGVEKVILEKYKVHSISESYFDINKKFKTKENTVSFAYEVDGLFKKYTPEQPKQNEKKSLIPHLKGSVFGLKQLPTEKIKNLIICEGEKDLIIAVSRGFNAVTFGSATNNPTTEQITTLQQRCENLFICYDDDIEANNKNNSGKDAQNNIIKKYDFIIGLNLPNKNKIKGYDLTDYFQQHTAQDFQKIIDLAVKNKNAVEVIENKKYSQYELPKEVNEPIENFIKDIENYSMFMANSQIWIMQGDSKNRYFKSVSNYEISILYHIQDEKKPIKLLRIKNTENQERVFDVPANAVNSRGKLENETANQGNYIFTGTDGDFKKLNRFLNDKMGVGSRIEVLGWQKQGRFWAWNNRINLANGKYLKIDDYGCFQYENRHYYLPSANKSISDNDYKFPEQKKFIYINSDLHAKDFFNKVINVHGQFGISAVLFSISSLFSDFIFEKVKGFPLLFLYGQASSGKTQLAFVCQSFLGHYQTPLNISNGVSTKVAGIREFAQFNNGISHLAEYKPNIQDTDSKLTGLWDRNGYKRGVADSNVATDNVPIVSSGVITGNYFPADEPLISRLIWLEMQGKEESEENKRKFFELQEIIDNGISSFSDNLIEKRNDFEINFHTCYKNCNNLLQNSIVSVYPRQIQNLSILFATYKVFENTKIFPFTEFEIIEHFKDITKKQNGKLKANNLLFKWWDCFLICFKTNDSNKISINLDIKIEGENLYFNFNNINQKVSRQWYNQYKENAPSISVISEAIKRENYYFYSKDKRIRTGGTGTSVFGIKINQLNIKSDFMDYYQYIISPAVI